ncbi:MAG: hypothetical protein K0Q59_2644 [Paenibacillus sp.]|nr:hypothetical protein [Paenibacillus sp.]
MKTHVGLAAPHDVIARVTEVAAEFGDRLQLHCFVYTNFEELSNLLEANKDLVDIWVFTGITAYSMAVESSPIQGKLLIQSGGSSLMKQLFQIMKDNRNPERVSIDTLLESECTETFLELGLAIDHLHTFPSPHAVPRSEWIEFHETLYNSKQVDACITHHIYVYEELKKRNIPVYRLVSTRMSIRQAFHLACQQGETNYFRKSQIAVAMISLKHTDNAYPNYYESYQLKLKVEAQILSYAETVSGTMMSLGEHRFKLTTARGAIEQGSDYPPVHLLNEIKLLTNADIYCGIGYGNNGRGAEQNASLALHHAEKKGDGSAIIVDEKGNIMDLPSSKDGISYNYRSDNTELIERLKQEGITVATYNKLVFVQRSMDKHALSAADIAERLNMSYRNANRVLVNLERCGLARMTGEEMPSAKGRPRKMYRITDQT